MFIWLPCGWGKRRTWDYYDMEMFDFMCSYWQFIGGFIVM